MTPDVRQRQITLGAKALHEADVKDGNSTERDWDYEGVQSEYEVNAALVVDAVGSDFLVMECHRLRDAINTALAHLEDSERDEWDDETGAAFGVLFEAFVVAPVHDESVSP